jgi:Carboxypeptidase regulatory-like domain
MDPSTTRRGSAFWLTVFGLFATLAVPLLGQSTGGRIIGRVADPTGAVLDGVKVTLTNQATGVSRETQTNGNGDYTFVEVVPGTYQAAYEHPGFKKNVQSSVTVDVNQVVSLNSILQLGEVQDVVQVSSEAPQVDTTTTQLGAVINDRSVNELPLNTRDTYQFLQLQPGVQAQLGSSGSLFFGSDDAGSVSVNGGRTRANNFSVNGGDANDQFVNTPTVQPTPDSVEEFRVITNTFDAEYGRNSGSVVNVITKSGSNKLHGDVYDYFRNTVLNAQGYFNSVKPVFNQNQFGGTLGGPIKKDRTFFFLSYEGRRVRQGQPGKLLNVPTAAERGGDFSDTGGPFSGGISNPLVAQVLDGRPGCDSALGLGANGIANLPVDPTTSLIDWVTVFPTAAIPTACQDPVAANLLQFVPTANVGTNQNQSVPVGSDYENQFTIRFDHKINDHQNFSAYYYFTDIAQLQPYNNFEEAGANVPGFGNFNNSRYQQWNLSHTWTATNSVVNEARFTYMREGQLGFLKPQTTGAVTASCSGAAAAFCFTGTSDSSAITSGYGTNPSLGITPGLPAANQGVPFIGISGGASIGNNWEGVLPQVGNSFQWSDGLTWVKGNHTFKFGIDARRARFDQTYYFNVNGEYTFNNTGPNAIVPNDGDNYAEYLLGIADTYVQGSAQREDVRSTSVYPFVQDSWKIKPNLTLNYGLRWELDTPPTDISGHVETFRPGQNSTVYPCDSVDPGDCPTGLVVPGDKGVPAGLTSTYYKAFAPRIGLAWSPGSSGKTSIRGGWGLFYNPIEELVMAQFGAEPPFGGSSSLSNVFFNTPFVGQNGTQNPNPFGGFITPAPGQAVDLSLFRPILLYGEFQPHLRAQYSAQYNLTIQQELAKDMMFQLGYVGSQGHRLLAGHDINPSNPQTCLDMFNISQYYAPTLADGTANPNANPTLNADYACGPTVEDSQWLLPANSIPAGYTLHLPYGPTAQVGPGNPQINLVGLRPYSSPNCIPTTGVGCPTDGVPVFTDIFAEDTIGNSSYNALEAMLEKRFSHGLQFQAAYTWSKSLDDASTFEESLNPFNYRASRGLSLFNSAQRFVISYYWELPIQKHQGFAGRVLNDWAISGITQFQTGFPIRLDTQNDSELINSLFFLGTEAPSLAAPFQKLNPKTNGNFWFNPNDFADPPLGQFNNGTQRTICCGPGLNDWDFSVHKKIPLTESTYLKFQAEFFNIFNHTNFANPDGHFSDGPTEFGKITATSVDQREVQLVLKLYF